MVILKYKKGFTLLELLVVIAVVAMLSAIMMSWLGFARGNGANAGMKTDLAQMRTQGNIYATANGNFGTAADSTGACTGAGTNNTIFADSKFASIISALQIHSSGGHTATCYSAVGGNPSWVVSIQLYAPQNGNNYVCTDSTEVIKYYASTPSTNSGLCP